MWMYSTNHSTRNGDEVVLQTVQTIGDNEFGVAVVTTQAPLFLWRHIHLARKIHSTAHRRRNGRRLNMYLEIGSIQVPNQPASPSSMLLCQIGRILFCHPVLEGETKTTFAELNSYTCRNRTCSEELRRAHHQLPNHHHVPCEEQTSGASSWESFSSF